MTPPLTVYVMTRTYDSYGGHRSLTELGTFLLSGSPFFGPALTELAVTLHFPAVGPPRSSLQLLFASYAATRATLPKTIFRRARQKASVDVASDLLDPTDATMRYALSLRLFVGGFHETIAAVKLLSPRFTKKDDFRFADFIAHCESREPHLPKSEEELKALDARMQRKRAHDAAAMSPWERLGIDWRDYHPESRRILDAPFFWEEANDFSPHGNDTGSDLLAEYRGWLDRHPDGDPLRFYEKAVGEFGSSEEAEDETAVALAFAEIKLRGMCPAPVVNLALKAVGRQRRKASAALWPHRDECLKSLDVIERKLQNVT